MAAEPHHQQLPPSTRRLVLFLNTSDLFQFWCPSMSDLDWLLVRYCTQLVQKVEKASRCTFKHRRTYVYGRIWIATFPPSRYLGVGVSCTQRGYLLLHLSLSPLAGQQFRCSLAYSWLFDLHVFHGRDDKDSPAKGIIEGCEGSVLQREINISKPAALVTFQEK